MFPLVDRFPHLPKILQQINFWEIYQFQIHQLQQGSYPYYVLLIHDWLLKYSWRHLCAKLWLLLSILVHCDLCVQQLVVTLLKQGVYFYPWFNQWPGTCTLTTDRFFGGCDLFNILRNYWAKNSVFWARSFQNMKKNNWEGLEKWFNSGRS